ncbi:hypothetical protein PLICRDRAFT_98013 [Plicaturopsis crispa FD-325 SS-3]|nr:hypothetical protein PLICRDRAFT_98013 [Plicaturopsis crispa FD-325 SS-3]
MDPQDPTSFNHRTERLSTGRTYHFVDQIPERHAATTPTILCVHGFPDLWYGWRYQIGPWVRKGYRVIAVDMLGYGGSDKPKEPEDYTTKRLSSDLAALLDLVGVRQAVIIGHDWGSYTVGRFALWYPERLLALIMMSVPFTPPAPVYIPIEEVAERVPNLAYQVYFADPSSTREIEENLDVFLTAITAVPKKTASITRKGLMRDLVLGHTKLPSRTQSVLNDAERKYYLAEFAKGMNGPLSYYRTSKIRFDEEKGLPNSPRSGLPVLYIYGTEDRTSTPEQARRAVKWIPGIQDVALEGRGHWIMAEAKEDVTNKIAGWLDGLLLSSGTQPKL